MWDRCDRASDSDGVHITSLRLKRSSQAPAHYYDLQNTTSLVVSQSDSTWGLSLKMRPKSTSSLSDMPLNAQALKLLKKFLRKISWLFLAWGLSCEFIKVCTEKKILKKKIHDTLLLFKLLHVHYCKLCTPSPDLGSGSRIEFRVSFLDYVLLQEH